MKKFLYLLFILILPMSIFASNTDLIHTKYDNQIDSNLRKTIYEKTQQISKIIQNENEEELRALLSHEFVYKIGASLSSFISTIKPVFYIDELVLLNDYYTTVKAKEKNKTYTIEAANDKSFIIDKIKIDDESFIQFYISKNSGIQDLIFLEYINENNDWKLNNIRGGVYSYENKTPVQLIEESKEFENKEEYASSILYAMAASQILKPTAYLRYKKHFEYREDIIKIINDLASIYPFPRQLKNGDNTSLFQINIQGSQNGLLPIIKYSTNTDISNHQAINKEAMNISKEIFSIYPDILKNFKYIIFQAYNELPNNPNKQYKIYNTILHKGELLK